jgi:hypothetical protein
MEAATKKPKRDSLRILKHYAEIYYWLYKHRHESPSYAKPEPPEWVKEKWRIAEAELTAEIESDTETSDKDNLGSTDLKSGMWERASSAGNAALGRLRKSRLLHRFTRAVKAGAFEWESGPEIESDAQPGDEENPLIPDLGHS